MSGYSHETNGIKMVSHQYICVTCGSVRFVDVEADGYEWLKQNAKMCFRIECPACTAKRDAIAFRAAQATLPDRLAHQVSKWIPPIYQATDISRLPEPASKLVNGLEGWLPRDRGLLFYGPTRRGKSRIAYYIANRLIRANYRVECYDCRTFRAEVDERVANQTLWDWHRQMQTLPVLLLDDLGKFKGAGKRIEEELYNVVKLRNEFFRPMIITTNDGPAELAAKFGDSIAAPLIARLDEMCDPVSFYLESELTQGKPHVQHSLEI